MGTHDCCVLRIISTFLLTHVVILVQRPPLVLAPCALHGVDFSWKGSCEHYERHAPFVVKTQKDAQGFFSFWFFFFGPSFPWIVSCFYDP